MYQSIVKLLSEKDIRIVRITAEYPNGILCSIGFVGKHRVSKGTQSVYPNGERGENDQRHKNHFQPLSEPVRFYG